MTLKMNENKYNWLLDDLETVFGSLLGFTRLRENETQHCVSSYKQRNMVGRQTWRAILLTGIHSCSKPENHPQDDHKPARSIGKDPIKNPITNSSGTFIVKDLRPRTLAENVKSFVIYT